ncbi:Rrf2 family transcriptional regulator [Rhizobium sp. KAs_5_22]|uniref:RrF2 family transcriptional regulator n=1 Tax=Ciceribacter selenitireducens TaxID=448181 RepID=UPI00048E79FD|nr:Rrf2 family transcriptional regulator [Ciceribacter selenitireducens]PPJ48993.1 Rrf2 family transcriptional regulator [Rhizobium sp. KAs_5_22]
MIDVRFATNLQILLSLALAKEEGRPRLTSAELANSLGANPALVRTMLVPLAKQGMVKSAKGKSGGVELARPADEITLGEIYKVSSLNKRLFSARRGIPQRCLVSSNISVFFDRLADETEDAVIHVLNQRTLGECFEELKALHDLSANKAKA